MDLHSVTDMIETDSTYASASATQQHQQQQGQDVHERELPVLARQLINQGKPSQAVLMAMKTKGGDEAVFQSLHSARELYINRLQENTAVDQLADLFAECVVAEAQPLNI